MAQPLAFTPGCTPESPGQLFKKSPLGLGPTRRCPDFTRLGLDTKQGSFLENRVPMLLLPLSGGAMTPWE